MSSLGDMQQIHSMLQQISKLLDEVDIKTDNVTKKTITSVESFKKLEAIVSRYLIVTRAAGLPSEVDLLIQKAGMMTVAINQLILTIDAAKAALIGAGPIGWLALGASALYTGLSFYNVVGG